MALTSRWKVVIGASTCPLAFVISPWKMTWRKVLATACLRSNSVEMMKAPVMPLVTSKGCQLESWFWVSSTITLVQLMFFAILIMVCV
jgi:hypothetical protein